MEIMSNPTADESLNEWVEIYNNGSETVNLSNWSIGDDSDTDSFVGGLYGGEGVLLEPGICAIITDEMTRVYEIQKR